MPALAGMTMEFLMIKHIVFFKFKSTANPADCQAALAGLRSLPKKIAVIRDFEVGEDILRLPRSWDAALVATYDTLEDLQTYADHPDHKAVASQLRELCEAVSSVDYEI